MALSPKLIALGKKLEADGLADLGSELVPALVEEIEALSPASAQSIEAMVFGAMSPTLQTALANLIAKLVAK